MLWFLTSLLLTSFAYAQDTQQQLNQYIKDLKLRALPSVSKKNPALYQLGLRLFYDTQLSGKDNISCHTCHSLSGYSGDALPLALGEGAHGIASKRHQGQGVIIPRHTPPLYNLGLAGANSLFWDGRIMYHPQGGLWTPEEGLNGPHPKYHEIAKTLDGLLAAQALFPMASPEEMLGQNSSLTRIEAWQAIMDRLFTGRLGASYRRFFREAYPGVENFNIGHAANAIAELERHHFLANNTPWDQYLRGEKKFMTEKMKRGALLFMTKASCTNCHNGEHLSSFGFQNIGIPQIGPGVHNGDDLGRMEVTQNENHKYRFRVSPLRNIALTAPYMHSGVFKNMWQVIDHYDHPIHSLQNFTLTSELPNYRWPLVLNNHPDSITERIQKLAPNLPKKLGLTKEEKEDLYCFLMVGLTDLKHQADLLRKDILDVLEDCSPRIHQ